MLERIKISDIKGAEYNPRYLSPEAADELKKSISTFGQIKPIIVRSENSTIVAGHQRTKIMKSLGATEVDCIKLKNVKKEDEVRFNQYHNICEVEVSSLQPIVKVTPSQKEGYKIIENREIIIAKKTELGFIMNMLSAMVARYGNFASVISTCSGDVIVSGLYANSIKLAGLPLLVYYISDEKKEVCINTFKKDYGTFSYEHLEKTTFVQSLAQMKRLKGKKQFKSQLYEAMVIPFLKKSDKSLLVLDFGSGEGAYAKLLSKQGYKIKEIEFYRKKDSQNVIDVSTVKKQFNEIMEDVKKNGLFDVVVCDSVLNSVDSLEAEKSVLITINALCKKNGMIFWSGRGEDANHKIRTTINVKTTLYFCDANLFSAIFRNGYWFYQKFHSEEMVTDLQRKYISEKFDYKDMGNAFKVSGEKTKILDKNVIESALRFEFSLPLPNGKYTFFEDNVEFFKQVVKWNIQ